MYFDLNFPVLGVGQAGQHYGSSKRTDQAGVVYNSTQLNAIEGRLDVLVHLGYTVVAFNQIVHKKIEKKTLVNTLDPLLKQLRARPGVVFLKRLTIILDEDSEKGFGLTNANAALLAPYDLISLTPTTAATFSLACLNHSMPTPLTAHIIALPLTHPRLPFNLKHTLVRTAIKNGAVFEINYAGALGVDSPAEDTSAGGADGAVSIKRNWWAAAREIVRVTKGKGILVSGGVVNAGDMRAPRDIANVVTLLGVPQDAAHEFSTRGPKALVLRAQSRKRTKGLYSVTVVASEAPPSNEPSQTIISDAPPPQSLSIPVSDIPSQAGVIPNPPNTSNKRPSEDPLPGEERPEKPQKKKKKPNKGKAKA